MGGSVEAGTARRNPLPYKVRTHVAASCTRLWNPHQDLWAAGPWLEAVRSPSLATSASTRSPTHRARLFPSEAAGDSSG